MQAFCGNQALIAKRVLARNADALFKPSARSIALRPSEARMLCAAESRNRRRSHSCVAATPATALGYWDFQGTLVPGASSGEGQAGTSGNWWIRNSRSNCNAVVEIRRHSDGVRFLVFAPNGCASTDYGVIYPLAIYNASHSINTGGSNVFVNVRIDATV